MPSQNNVKATLCILKYFYLLNNLFHHEFEMNAAHSHQQFHLAHPHSFCFYLGKAVRSPTGLAGFGLDVHVHGRCHAHTEQDGSSSTARTGAEVPQSPGQPAAPGLLCQQRKSLSGSRGRQEHLDIHVVDKRAWSFLLGCQAKASEETIRNWNVRCIYNFLLITNFLLLVTHKKMEKELDSQLLPGRTKRKKSHGFQLPGDDVCWQQQNFH